MPRAPQKLDALSVPVAEIQPGEVLYVPKGVRAIRRTQQETEIELVDGTIWAVPPETVVSVVAPILPARAAKKRARRG